MLRRFTLAFLISCSACSRDDSKTAVAPSLPPPKLNVGQAQLAEPAAVEEPAPVEAKILGKWITKEEDGRETEISFESPDRCVVTTGTEKRTGIFRIDTSQNPYALELVWRRAKDIFSHFLFRDADTIEMGNFWESNSISQKKWYRDKTRVIWIRK